MNIDPKHLAQLSTIVETGSFQVAADHLCMTQPGLSRNMRALETRLGASLFDRDGRRSIPNLLALRLARNGLAIRVAEEQANLVAVQYAKRTIISGFRSSPVRKATGDHSSSGHTAASG